MEIWKSYVALIHSHIPIHFKCFLTLFQRFSYFARSKLTASKKRADCSTSGIESSQS